MRVEVPAGQITLGSASKGTLGFHMDSGRIRLLSNVFNPNGLLSISRQGVWQAYCLSNQ